MVSKQLKKLKICVLGAANVDIIGFTTNKLVLKDSNIGKMETSPGGVGRNIAENLNKLGFNINLISAFGDDSLSEYIKKSCNEKGINIEHSFYFNQSSASTFIGIIDEQNNLAVGISAMDIYNRITEKMIHDKADFISTHDYIVLDTNFPFQILEQIANRNIDSKLILDTVSGKKALKSKNILSKLYMLKTNLLEAQMISSIQIETHEDLKELVSYFLGEGVQNVFITLGQEGVIYGNKKIIEIQKPIKATVLNTTGAGDAFVAGLVYGDALGYDISKTAKMGLASSSLNVTSRSVVSPEMSIENITKIFNEYE